MAGQFDDKKSAGLSFLEAADASLPRTLGDRVAIHALDEILGIAIRCRMVFGRNDAAALMRLNIETCAGVFRPLDDHWYTAACRAGGTFAAMWERHSGLKPWIAPTVFTGPDLGSQAQNNRVARNMAVLLPFGSSDEGPDWPVFSNFEVWWCTSLDLRADTITLCRYRFRGDRVYPLNRDGPPARRRVFDREAWKALFAPAGQVAA